MLYGDGLLDRLDDGHAVPSAAHRQEIVDRFEQTWCAPLAEADLPARRIVQDGAPVDVLLAAADEDSADLIVVGTRGVGGDPEQVLGRTSHQLVARSTRPVVVVPAR